MADLDRVVAALEELARAALVGPWVSSSDTVLQAEPEGPGDIVCQSPDEDCAESLKHWEANRDYIAECDPQTILSLIARLRHLEQACLQTQDLLKKQEVRNERLAETNAKLNKRVTQAEAKKA